MHESIRLLIVMEEPLPAADVVIVQAGTPDGEAAAQECATAGIPVLRLGSDPQKAPAVHLTRRENQLLALVSEGLKNKEISARMGITAGTVKMYLEKLFDKVGARDRYELALYGLQTLRRSDLVQALSSNAGFALLGAVRASRHEGHAC
jgi:DNA-binding CsgD family transcriptional regulator